MAIDPSISLGIKPVQIADPMEQLGKVQNLISMRQQQQMNTSRIQQEQMANQKNAIAMRDTEIMRQAYLGSQGDPKKARMLAIQGGAGPEVIDAFDKHTADIEEKYAKAANDRLPVLKDQNDRMLALHDQALQMAQQDPQKFAQAWPQIYQAAVASDPETAKHFDPGTPPTVDQIQLSKVAHLTTEYGIKQQQEKRAQEQEARAQALAVPQLDKAKADAVIAAQDAAGQKPIQPEQKARLDLEQRAAEQTATHNKATEQNATALLKVAQGRLGIESQHAQIAQKIYDQTYGEGANPSLVGVEPKLRTQAMTAAQKAADEFTKASESAANMRTFIELAKSGNKAAGSNLPLVGAETIQALNGIKRINKSEIEQYQGAGSILDRVQGKIGKLVSGQPIPADVMKDIEALHSAVSGNAAKTYNDKLGSINQNYRSNFKPVASATGGGGVIRARDPQGVLHEAPAGTPLPAGWKAE